MQDTELYQYLLGLKTPWTVGRVEMSVKDQRVDVWAEHPRGAVWGCPTCARELTLYDHAEERVWRHLDSCQFQTYLHARIPLVQCPDHGVVQVMVPWAEPKSRFTILFERLAIDVLRQCDVSGATRILRISLDEAWHIMERAVARGKLRKAPEVVRHIGVDEKAAAKGHRYLTLVCDLDKGSVEHIAEDRKKESLESCYRSLPKEQKEGIEAVAMDMWVPFFEATRDHLPDAGEKIVFDRFHVMGYINEAVDTVRKKGENVPDPGRPPAEAVLPALDCGADQRLAPELPAAGGALRTLRGDLPGAGSYGVRPDHAADGFEMTSTYSEAVSGVMVEKAGVIAEQGFYWP